MVHTILFNRALGHVAPRDVDLQLINVSYVEIDDASVAAQVESSLDDILTFITANKAKLAASQRSGGAEVRALRTHARWRCRDCAACAAVDHACLHMPVKTASGRSDGFLSAERQSRGPCTNAHSTATYRSLQPPQAGAMLQGPSSDGVPLAVQLAFYESRTKQGLVRPYQEKVFWERWRIRLRLVDACAVQTGALRCTCLAALA